MHRLQTIYRLTLLAAFLVCAALSFNACDTEGDDPIGSLLTSTSYKIVYWESASGRFIGNAVRCIAIADDNTMFVSVRDSGVYVSSDQGTYWTDISTGLPEHIDIKRLSVSTNSVLYGVSDTAVYRYAPGTEGWMSFSAGIKENTICYGVTNDAAHNPYVYSSTGLYALTPDKQSWELVSGGLPQGTAITDIDFLPNGMVAAITDGGEIFRSLNGQSGWVPVYLPFFIDSAYSIAQNPAGDLCILLKSRRLVVYRLDTELPMSQLLYAEEIKFFNGIAFLQEVQERDSDPYSNDIKRYKMMRSIDGGVNWAPMYSGLGASIIDFVFDAEGNGFAVASNGGMTKTRIPIK